MIHSFPISGTCQCYKGFAGLDCSVNLTFAPSIKIVNPVAPCDIRVQPCDFILIVGGPFVASSDLFCIFEEAEVSYRTV